MEVHNPPEDTEEPVIPTETFLTNCRARHDNCVLAKHIEERAPDLMIFDLYRAKYDAVTKLFSFNEYRFKNVTIMGQVIGIQPYRDSYIFDVDDGSSRIRVFGVQTLHEDVELRKEVLENLNDLLKNRRDKSVTTTKFLSRSLFSTAHQIQESCPLSEKICRGDVIQVTGSLTEYEEQRNVFVNIITRVTTNTVDFRYKWLHNCLEMYDDNTSFFNKYWVEHYNIPGESS